jgi:hypothetical protein
MYRALIVCNWSFPDDPAALGELHGPKVDGVVFRDALSHHETGMFETNDIRIVHDADSLEVCRAIEDFFRPAAADDTMLFYYSGHGRTRDQQLFLCARNTVVDRLHSTAISDSTLSEIVKGSYSQVKVIILDCCYGAQFKGSEIFKGIAGEGRYIIAAGRAMVADGKSRGDPSPFTQALAEALTSRADDSNGDGIVDIDDVFSYLNSTPFEDGPPHREFGGSGAIPIARRILRKSPAHPNDNVRPSGHAGRSGYLAPAAKSWDAAREYLDTLAPGASFNAEKVSEFRQRMHDDVARSMPEQLMPAEFLQRADLIRNDSLTYAGVLLFGDSPTVVLPSAVAQCTQFYGLTKSEGLESTEIRGTVPEMISAARDYVANLARLGETPTTDSAYAGPTYKYPMIAVREIIANAIVHRDYQIQESCVQIHVFADRIEVINPGTWGALPSAAAVQTELGQLEQQSRRRNFRLARILTWSKLVEGVGAGIPRALVDCRAFGAPEPMVSSGNNMVTVTIYPRQPAGDVTSRGKIELGATRPTRLTEVNPKNPVFFLSYARSRTPDGRADNRIIQFYNDLSENVAELVGLPAGVSPGFMDESMSRADAVWASELLNALGTCQVFVALLSVPYVNSSWCGMEWSAFSKRLVTARDGGSHHQAPIIPVIWAPVPSDQIPRSINEVQHFSPRQPPDFEASYEAEGIYGLMRMGREEAYQLTVWRLAQKIAEFYFDHPIEPGVTLTDDLFNAFDEPGKY